MKTNSVPFILSLITATVGSSLTANAQTSGHHSLALATGAQTRMERIQMSPSEQAYLRSLAAENAAKKAEAAAALAQDREYAKQLNEANRGQ